MSNITFLDLKRYIELAEKSFDIEDDDECYIDVYECLVVVRDDDEVVVDVNGDDIFIR